MPPGSYQPGTNPNYPGNPGVSPPPVQADAPDRPGAPARPGPRNGRTNPNGLTATLNIWAAQGKWDKVRATLRGLDFNLPNDNSTHGGPLVRKALEYYKMGQSRQSFNKWLAQRNAAPKPNGGGAGPVDAENPQVDPLQAGGDLLNGAMGAFPQLDLTNVDLSNIQGPQTPDFMNFYKMMTQGDKKWMKDPRLLATALTDLEYRQPIMQLKGQVDREHDYRGQIAGNVNSAFQPLLDQNTQDQEKQNQMAQALAQLRGGQTQGLASTLGEAGANFATQQSNNAAAENQTAVNNQGLLQLQNQGNIRERGLITGGRESDSRIQEEDLRTQLAGMIKNRGAQWGANLTTAMNNRAGMFEKAMGLAQAKQGMDMTGALGTDQLKQGRLSTLQQLQNLRQSGVDFNSGQIERALNFAGGQVNLAQGMQGLIDARGAGKLTSQDKMNVTNSLLGEVLPDLTDPSTGMLLDQYRTNPTAALSLIKAQAQSYGVPWKQIQAAVKARLAVIAQRPSQAQPLSPSEQYYQQLIGAQQ